MEPVDRPYRRTCRGMFLSAVLHALYLVIILFSVKLSAQDSGIERVFLTLEPSGGRLGQIRREAAGEENPHAFPGRETRVTRAAIQKTSRSDPARQADPPPVEQATESVPLQTEKSAAAPLRSVGSGAGEESSPSSAAGIGAADGGGSGPGIGSGRSGGAATGGESLESLKNRYLREHFAYIRSLILKNLSYPPLARKNGWQGSVKVSFVVREDGRAECIRIFESSGYVVLDRNVVETIRQVQPFPKPPVSAQLFIPVTYKLKT